MISCDASFCGGSGEVVRTGKFPGKWHSSIWKGCKVMSGRQAAHVGPFAFRLTRGRRVFGVLGAYVVVMKGSK
jgi:hypothetical protein